MTEILIDRERCTVCALCVRSCPAEILIKEQRKIIVLKNECFECRACEVGCPDQAIVVNVSY
ncbi:MAG: 4Fe-4S binding protein [Promethearchaeota archaeon]